MTKGTRIRIAVVAAATVVTLGVHYGWLIDPIFGHVHWIHAVHGRFCYIPIVMAAAWFGLRGGIVTAAAISLLVLPLVLRNVSDSQDLATEVAEIVFYFALAALVGALVDREYAARRLRREAQQQVEHSQKLSLVGQIAAGVAHEIKNPLSSIKGAADILTDDATSREEREEFKGILGHEVRRIDATVAEFLEFARPREARLERMNLSDAVRQTARQMEAQAHRDGVTLNTDIVDDVCIEGDSGKIQQMTLNLLLNAVQASEQGSAVLVRVNRGARAARIVVEDRGSGIDAADRERIFEPFFTTRSSGSGLGLAVVRAIVDAHDGEIDVSCRSHRGTIVAVSLPLAGDGAR